MKLGSSYLQILSISLPIIIGSAVQNVITLSDSVFLYHLSSVDFQAIGLVGVLYLMVASIGFGFSRGAQIIIARRYGEGDESGLVNSFYTLIYFELFLAFIMFFILQFGSPWFFEWTISDPEIVARCVEYIIPRSYGIFFSYLGVGIIALYSGVAKTKFILIDTVFLALINVFLNYVLIFGKWGFPEMGIAGAGLASTIAEIAAVSLFILYMAFESSPKFSKIFQWPKVTKALILNMSSISMPIVIQAIVGFGSWYVFFALIEKLGGRALEITNLGRIVYLLLSIPTWGFASGVNTLVSNFIGSNNRRAVNPIITKTVKLNLLISWAIGIPLLFFPSFFLYPLFGGDDMSLFVEAQPVFYMIFFILTLFAIGGIYFNALIGTGASKMGLRIQIAASTVYLIFVYLVIVVFDLGLIVAWSSELVYWTFILLISLFFMFSNRWYKLKV